MNDQFPGIIKNNSVMICILCLAGVLLFANLGNQYLWQDESETAVLAKRMIQFGYPRAFDGKNLINPTIRTGYSENYAWRYHPWMQFFLAAVSFEFLGESTFYARFPFAVLGLINILLLYLLVLYVTSNKFIAACSAFLLTSSVPYLLLMRQCRYYSPAVFLVLIISIFYLRYLDKKAIADLGIFTVALGLLGYTVHGMFVPVFAAIGIHSVFFAERKLWPGIFTAITIALLAVIPWLVYSNSTAHVAAISLSRSFKNLEFQVRMINKFIFPVFFFISMYAARIVLIKKWKITLSAGERKFVFYSASVILASLAAFCFAEERNFRYLVYFIPLFSVVQAMILFRLVKFNKYVFVLFLGISLITGAFNMGYTNFYLPKYLYEITHDYDGPIEGIVKFLNENADKDDTVKILYGDLPLMFYTDFKIDNSQVYDDEHMPEWIVYRRGWDPEVPNDKYYRKVEKTYNKYVLDYPDIKWENRPGDMSYHRFSTDKKAPGVVIYGRKER